MTCDTINKIYSPSRPSTPSLPAVLPAKSESSDAVAHVDTRPSRPATPTLPPRSSPLATRQPLTRNASTELSTSTVFYAIMTRRKASDLVPLFRPDIIFSLAPGTNWKRVRTEGVVNRDQTLGEYALQVISAHARHAVDPADVLDVTPVINDKPADQFVRAFVDKRGFSTPLPRLRRAHSLALSEISCHTPHRLSNGLPTPSSAAFPSDDSPISAQTAHVPARIDRALFSRLLEDAWTRFAGEATTIAEAHAKELDTQIQDGIVQRMDEETIQLRNQQLATQEENERLRLREIELEKVAQTGADDIAQLRQELSNSREATESLQKLLKAAESQWEALISSLETAEQKVKEAEDKSTQSQEEAADLQRQLAALVDEKSGWQMERATLNKRKAEHEGELEDWKKKYQKMADGMRQILTAIDKDLARSENAVQIVE